MFALAPLVFCAAHGGEGSPLTIFSDEDEAEYSVDDIIPIGADIQDEVTYSDYDYSDEVFVVDNAGILTDEQNEELELLAHEIAERHDFGVYLVIINDYTEYGYEIEDAAEYIYDGMNFGLGNDNRGLLLLMSMDDRSYDLDAYGWGNTAFTDYGKEVLSHEFLGNFRNDDWYGGFKDYITVSENFLIRAEEGDPIDVRPDEYDDYGYEYSGKSYSFFDQIKDQLSTTFLIMIPLALIIAGIGISSEKRKMNNIHMATEAASYVQDSRINFNRSNDVYTHSTTSRVRIRTESTSSLGGRSSFGGGTTIRPSGHSHHSGHF